MKIKNFRKVKTDRYHFITSTVTK